MKPASPQPVSLRANALSLSSVLTQGITHIAPAMGLVVAVQFVTTMAGHASPLAYGIAFLVVMMLGMCLAKRLWGRTWIFVLIAVINSILGAAIAGTNAAVRVFFAMGRAGSLPAALDNVHPRFRTPVNAIILQTLITLTLGIAVGFRIGPDQEYYFFGVAMTLVLILIYSAGNIGVFFLYPRERPAEFSPLLHFIFPLLSTLSLAWVAYKSIVPLPDAPLRYAPVLVGTWLVAGVLVLVTVPRASNMPLLPLEAVAINPAKEHLVG